MNTGEKYVLKALDNYPWNLEESIECLSYALSYDENNTNALNLMGRIYAEQLFDYKKAEQYFLEALSNNVYAIEVYPYYIQLLLDVEKYDEALKTINFALTLRGINKANILLKKIIFYERQFQFKEGLEVLKELKLIFVSNVDMDLKFIEERLREKKKQQKKLRGKKSRKMKNVKKSK